MKYGLKKKFSIISIMIIVSILLTACGSSDEVSNNENTTKEDNVNNTVTEEQGGNSNNPDVNNTSGEVVYDIIGMWGHFSDSIVISLDEYGSYVFNAFGNVIEGEYVYTNNHLVLYEGSDVLDEGYIDEDGDLIMYQAAGYFEKASDAEDESDYIPSYPDDVPNPEPQRVFNEVSVEALPAADVEANIVLYGTWSNESNEIYIEFSEQGAYKYDDPNDEYEYGYYGQYTFDGTTIYFTDGTVGEFYMDYDSLYLERAGSEGEMFYYNNSELTSALLPGNGYIPFTGTWQHQTLDMQLHFRSNGTYRLSGGGNYVEGIYELGIGEIYMGHPDATEILYDYIAAYNGMDGTITLPEEGAIFSFYSTQPLK